MFVLIGVGSFVANTRNSFSNKSTPIEQVANARALTLNDHATMDQLFDLSPSEIEYCDIALMNLLCAQGLPGAEAMNITNLLSKLDQWTEHVQEETERNFHQYRDNPAAFYNSEGYFRMLMMAVVMYEDYGIRYNPARIVMPVMLIRTITFFADSRDVFLHGLIGDRRMGTCSSMLTLKFIGRFCQQTSPADTVKNRAGSLLRMKLFLYYCLTVKSG